MVGFLRWLVLIGGVVVVTSRGATEALDSPGLRVEHVAPAIEVEGALHESLQETLRSDPYMRVLRLDKPRRCRKMSKNKHLLTARCAVNVITTKIGLRGTRSSFAFLIVNGTLSDHALEATLNAFPCVANRLAKTTVCHRQLPTSVRNGTWTVLVGESPELWTGPIPDTATPAANNATIALAAPFVHDKDNPSSVYGIAVATTVRETGAYVGTGRLDTDHRGDYSDVHFTIDKAGGNTTCASARLVAAAGAVGNPPSALGSWRSWFEGDDLVVDLTLSFLADSGPPTSDNAHAAVRSLARYTIQNITTGNAWMRFDISNRCDTEPKLCVLGSLASACQFMTAPPRDCG